jgi:hypothetical protein
MTSCSHVGPEDILSHVNCVAKESSCCRFVEVTGLFMYRLYEMDLWPLCLANNVGGRGKWDDDHLPSDSILINR